ncbi:hypothetical protein H0H93_000853 [Arthromyces matolae]|nr:hypothetical protein H0H93_000853 [Arthromyces matolae]
MDAITEDVQTLGSRPSSDSDVNNDNKSSHKRTRQDNKDQDRQKLPGPETSAGESNSQRVYPDNVISHTIIIRNGIRFHHINRSGVSQAPSPPLQRPFNHSPLRQNPSGLRRQGAFYHRSHYEIAWVPEFGDYDKPPMTVRDTLPAHYRSRPHPATTISSSSSNTNPDVPIFTATSVSVPEESSNGPSAPATSPVPPLNLSPPANGENGDSINEESEPAHPLRPPQVHLPQRLTPISEA